jgi:uncharacterized repeat protein (TIGR03843 family)
MEVAAILDLLTFGDLQIEGRLVDASNLALLGRVELEGVHARVMYKPVQGERPLWDFPDGTLANREAAAFVVSAVGGWGVVPPTVLRDGPLGEGSVQLWIGDPDAPPEEEGEALIDVVPPARVPAGWLPVFDAQLPDGSSVVVAHADREDLAATAVFDVVINNADRKGSHLVLDGASGLWGFDHGVSFHAEPKLRTVLWGWLGEPVGEQDLDRLGLLDRLLCDPHSLVSLTLSELITPAEMVALQRRVARLLRVRRYPRPGGRWPAVPWPPL